MGELGEVLAGLGAPRLLVLGDLMLDQAVVGEAERVCPEAAALVLRRESEEWLPGGAANVAVLAQSLGARVCAAGVVGNDDAAECLEGVLQRAGVGADLVYPCSGRPTTLKQRFVAQAGRGPERLLLRVDAESREPLSPLRQRHLARNVCRRLEECDALLVADHGKGVCTPALLAEVIAAAKQRGLPVLVDPARGVDYARYRGADLLAPNRTEAAAAVGAAVGSPEGALAAAHALAERAGVAAVLVKLDADGMALAAAGEPDRVFPARAAVVRDVTGAGDLVLAVLGLCRACGVDWPRAAGLANAAAGAAVGRPDRTPLRREDLHAALAPAGGAGGKRATLAQMAELAEVYRRNHRRVVLTNGCFDLLHAGHAACLQEAAALGDVLVVAVNDDAGVRRLKGPGRPLMGQEDRAAVLAALGCVGHVLLFAGDTPHEVLRRVRPDVLVKGGDYAAAEVAGREVVEGYGGRVVVVGRRPGLSTTGVIAAARAGVGAAG